MEPEAVFAAHVNNVNEYKVALGRAYASTRSNLLWRKLTLLRNDAALLKSPAARQKKCRLAGVSRRPQNSALVSRGQHALVRFAYRWFSGEMIQGAALYSGGTGAAPLRRETIE